MLTMEYCVPHQHKYACSTMSSETLSGSCGSRNNRIRTVKLVRPSNGPLPPPTLSCRHGPSLGFSVRGGREHGTGFFVSYVEPGSEAHNQGLRIGDQIIRVNGFTVEDAVHKEVLQLISNHTHLTLKVRSVGMIPVKDKKTDVLSWQIISDNSSSSRSSPQLSEKVHDVRISIMVAPRSKLGCGICKGPEWKPGIFVQFTKEGGIAREAGLRPGDQILFCNNVDFSDIPFNEAVNLMKTSRQLDLVIRKSAGSELFPGESSGYNSSASSVTGDQSPSWSDSKRLSIVKEENLDLEDRLSHLDRLNKRISNCKKWNTIEWDEDVEEKTYFKPTIINVSESGTTIKNNGSDCQNFENNKNNNKIADIRMISQQHETKTVIVEVHRSDVEEKNEKSSNGLAKSSSTSSFSSLTSKSSNASVTSSSLSSAICMEIQRRMEKKVTKEEKPSIDEQIQMKKILKGVNTDQQYQHNKLMDEFKKAHQKMFKSPGESPQKDILSHLKQNNTIGKDTMDRLAHKELSQKLSERLSNLTNNEPQGERLPTTNSRQQVNVNNPPPPPPPPPLEDDSTTPPPSSTESTPNTRTNTLKPNKTKPKAPPVPVKYSVLSFNQPPPCPTPDYDTISISSSTSTKPSQNVSDSVEMESLESFKINHPSDVKPKPPSTYFPKRQLAAQLSNGSVSSMNTLKNGTISSGNTLKNGTISSVNALKNGTISSMNTLKNGSVSSVNTLKKPRPVSVTIGEYPSMRRQPGRLDFLQNGTEEISNGKEQPITSQLATELTQTLNRSNLRKRTESMENLLGSPQIKPQSNGSVRISLSNALSKNFAKSTSDLTGDLDVDNRIMINVNQDKKSEPPNGILKNTIGNTNTLPSPPTHKPLVQQKSITFGEMPVVIKDRPPLPVT